MAPIPDTTAQDFLLLTVLKVITIGLGFLVVYLGLKAWRGSRKRSLLWLALGMAVMALSSISEAFAYQGLNWTLGQSHLFSAVVQLIAFAMLVWSLYA